VVKSLFALCTVVLTSISLLLPTATQVKGEDIAKVGEAKDEVKDKLSVARFAQDVSVTIKAGAYAGSGALVTTSDGTTWCWTAAHVCKPLRTTREVIDDKGGKRTKVEFEDAKVLRFYREKVEGRLVSEYSCDAEVIRYSDATFGNDLCLLRLRDAPQRAFGSAKFYLNKELPEIGSELYHCGSLLGPFGSNSLMYGMLSQHGRVIDGKVFTQCQCGAFPGSSGGVVCLKNDGRYIGMLVMGAGEGFNLIVPISRMLKWAKQVGVDFTLDHTKEVPTEEELNSKPIEDAPVSTSTNRAMQQRKASGLTYYLMRDKTSTEPEVDFGLPLYEPPGQ